MINFLKAHAISNGLRIDESEDGPFITGGLSSPIGVDGPIGSVYFRPVANGFDLWQKFGPGVNDWEIKQFTADALITQFFADNEVATTTSKTFQNKINVTTSILSSGKYAIFWALEYTNNNNNQSSQVQVLFSSNQIAIDQQTFGSGTAGTYTIRSAVFLSNTISGAQTFQIQFRSVSGGTTAIRRATIGYIKVE